MTSDYFIGVCALCLQPDKIARDSDGHFFCTRCNATVKAVEHTRDLQHLGDEARSLTDEDKHLLNEIDRGIAGLDVRVGQLLRAYYADPDRAERTPRALLYFHLGFMIAAVQQLSERDH